ncbi:MAG: M23 family metallopeptidase [Ferruginibacter sp.]
MKKLIPFLFVIYILFGINTIGFSQLFPAKNYPQNYFQWPVGATVGIAANFGELRPNHFHMGLDARTERKENMPVYAAAQGYIAKVKIEPSGFGRCIYINHPNGITTLYAHLNNFYPALEKYITEQQYRLQQWRVFIDIPPNLFPVNKGAFIAFSGNTGGSQGPHLHFEIRDTKTDKVLNPLLFNFPIADKTPPDIIRLVMYDRCISTYEQTPKIIALKKMNGIYQPVAGTIIANSDKISFAITAYDRYTGSTNQNGIYKAVVMENNVPVSGFEMDSISYDETRYLNAHIDYSYRSRGGSYLQHLSNLPGYSHGIYAKQNNNGIINLEDETVKSIRIEVSDADGNTSTILLQIKAAATFVTPAGRPGIQEFHPGFINVFENNNVRFYLSEKSLYDSFRFRYKEMQSPTAGTIYQLHEPTVPVHNYFPISIRGSFADTGKVVMKRFFGAKTDYVKATENKGWYTAKFREFGNFQLMVDTLPPFISAVSRSATRLAFYVTDNTEQLNNFNAYLDNKWLRFSNDKGRTFIYNFDEHCPPGPHQLKITVEDQVGNRSEKVFSFTR